MGPEKKFPACYTDAEAVVRWALANRQELANNSSAIVGVAGDSAGANMSASVCHLVQGLAYQVRNICLRGILSYAAYGYLSFKLFVNILYKQ